MKEFDYCHVMIEIERDPSATVVLTIGQYYGLAKHIRDCKECFDITERVNKIADERDHNQIGFNPN